MNAGLELFDTGVNRDEAIAQCEGNLNFLGMFCLPDMFKFLFPPVFLAVWQIITDAAKKTAGQTKLALGLPRGFGKTILLKLFTVWVIVFTKKKFILVVCNTQPLAINFIADVCDVLSSLNFLRVFGDWRMTLETDRQELKKFTFRGRSIILAGLGVGGSPRGFNIKYVRPDLMIMDDIQSREQAKSPTEASAVFEWMLSTLMKANDKICCLFIFIGNKYPYEGTILKKLEKNSQWISFVTGAILQDGQSIWPELQSVDMILDDLAHDMEMGHPEIFFSEVMNDDVAGSRSGLDFSKINVWRDEDYTAPIFPEAGFVIIDPSAAKKKSDDVAIGAVLCYSGEPMLREVRAGKFNPGETIRQAVSVAAKYGINTIVVEDVAYQSTLAYWIEQVTKQLGLTSIKVLCINPEGEMKNSRILEWFKTLTTQHSPVVQDPRSWVHKDCLSQVLNQAVYFDATKRNNRDDILDIGAYMYRVVNKFRYDILLAIDVIATSVSASHEEDLQLEF